MPSAIPLRAVSDEATRHALGGSMGPPRDHTAYAAYLDFLTREDFLPTGTVP